MARRRNQKPLRGWKAFAVNAALALGLIIAAALALSLASQAIVARRESRRSTALEASLARTSIGTEELTEDIAWLELALRTIHPRPVESIPIGDIDEVAERLAALRDRPGSLSSRLELYRALAPIVSSLGDEHTALLPPRSDVERYLAAGGRLFPLAVDWREGGLVTLEGSDGLPRGSRIASINGLDASRIREGLSRAFSGTNDEQRLAYASAYFPEALYAVLGLESPFRIASMGPDGIERTIAIDGSSAPRPVPPVFEYRLEGGLAVISLRAFSNRGGFFGAFLAESFKDMEARGAEGLAIDLRGNKGGDTSMGDLLLSYLTDRPFSQYGRIDFLASAEARERFIGEAPGFIRWLPIQYLHPALKPLWSVPLGLVSSTGYPERGPADVRPRFAGRVFVVTDPGSMSSSTLLASSARKYAGATVVGRAPGGRDSMYGGMAEYRLPRTGLEVELPCAVLYGNTLGYVSPDHEVEPSLEDARLGRDAELERCRELLGTGAR